MTEETPENKPEEIYYASVNARMFASFVDCLALLVILFVLTPVLYPLYGVIYNLTDSHPDIAAFYEARNSVRGFSQLYQLMIEHGILKRNLVDILALYTLSSVLVIPLWMKFQATPGKMLIRAKVVDVKTMEKPSKLRLIIRYCSYPLSVAPFFLGFMFAGISRKKQSFHDIIAGTTVVYTKKPWTVSFLPKPQFGRVLQLYKDMYAEFKKK